MIIKKNFLFFICSTMLLSYVVGNRGDTNDTATYVHIFKNINEFNLFNPIEFYEITGVEIGYGWYSYLISLFTQNHFFLLSIFSFLNFFIIYKVSDKMKINYFPVFLLYVSSAYFLMQQFMQMRQGVAIPIALLAIITVIISRRKVTLSFIILSCVAFSLHQTAFLVIFCGYLLNIYLTNKFTSVKKFKFFVIFIFFISILISKFFLIDIFLNFSDRLVQYSNSTYSESINLLRIPNVKSVLVLVLLILLMNDKMNKNSIFRVFLCLLSIGVAFRIGFSNFAILSGRLSTAFLHTEIFLLPFIFSRFRYFYGNIMLFFYVLLQFISVYFFQAPYVLEFYFYPLEV